MRKLKILTFLCLITLSCAKKNDSNVDKKNENKTGEAVTKKSLWKKTKELVVESDEEVALKEKKYFIKLQQLDPSYLKVESWFNDKDNSRVFDKEGEIYKIFSCKVVKGNNITYEDYTGALSYLYNTKKYYYLYTFVRDKEELICTDIRRVSKGFRKQQMYNMKFENDVLVNEVFISDVSEKFHTNDGIQYLRIFGEIYEKEISNEYNLGNIRDF